MAFPSPVDTINVLLVGYGMIGRLMHAPLIDSVAGLELHAVVSSRPQAVHADHPQLRVFQTLDEALRDADIALVVIATPNDSHAPLAHRALAAGCHVIVDKPATLDADEARALATAAASRGLMFSVFHNRRWDADFLTLKRLIADDALGEIGRCHMHYDRFRPEVQDRWRERPGPGSGSWYDLGSHLVDQTLVLFGRPQAVWAELAALRPGGDTVDFFHVVLHYPRHRVVLESHAMSASNALRYAVDGRRASYRKSGLDSQEQSMRDGGYPGQPQWGLDRERGTLTHGDGTIESVENATGDYRCFYANVAAHLRHGEALAVTPAQVIDVMRVIDAAIESSRKRREVVLSG
ncbi:oxidoreductase [Kushneria aurantia]|uniref:Oxidoreductase n=1 Tax=Kushneria aurantia TaxID=504092 RepID=A0ABV6G3E5_9GAMM|nr:oxidoreductase [Kushneria aurantia]